MHLVFDAVAAGRGRVGAPFSLLLYSPPLCQRVLDLSDYLRRDSYLSSSLRELASEALEAAGLRSVEWPLVSGTGSPGRADRCIAL